MINLSGSSLGIGLAIKLRDEFSSKARTISGEMDRLYDNSKRIQEANLRAIRRGGLGMMGAGLLAAKGFGQAFDIAAEYDFKMRTIRVLTNATTQEFKQMNDTITQLGTNSIYTISDVASAMEQLVRQGFSAGQAIKALPGIVYLGAAAGGKPIGGKGGMGDIVSNILHQFNRDASQASRVADLLAMAANKSASDVEDLGLALSYSAGKAHQLGFSEEEVLSLLSVLSNAGLRGGIAGRGVFSMMTYLTRAASSFRTNRQVEAFQAIGLGLNDIMLASGKLKPMGEILDVFSKKLRKMSAVEASGALSALMMMRGDRTMLPLLERAVKVGLSFDEMKKTLTETSTGYAKKISDFTMGGPKGAIERMKDTWYALREKIGEIISPMVVSGLRRIITFLNKLVTFVQTPFGTFLVKIALGVSVIVAAAGAFLVVFTSIRLMSLASTVTFANMGRSLALAWNMGAAAAARYAAVAQGAMFTPTGGVIRRGANGRFISAGLKGAGASAAGSAAVSSGSLWTRVLGRVIGGLKAVGNFLGPVARGLGFIVTVAGFLVGFGNMIKSVVYILGTFANVLLYIYDIFRTWNFGLAGENFKRRNDALIKGLGFDDSGIMIDSKKKRAEEAAYKDMIKPTRNSPFDQMVNDYKSKQRMQLKLDSVVNLDGKKLGEIQREREIDDLSRLLKGTR